jgi:hypothetical protein
MQIIKPITYTISAAAVIVAPAFIENKIVPLIEALIQSIISNL